MIRSPLLSPLFPHLHNLNNRFFFLNWLQFLIDPDIVLLPMFLLRFIFVIVCVFWVKTYLCRISIICLYLYWCWWSNYQEGEGWDLINCFNPPHISLSICLYLYWCWWSNYQEEEGWDLINCFNPPHIRVCHKSGPGFPMPCSFLNLMIWAERWLFVCWLWWNCWLSLIKLCFHNTR
jgi:hypothetical protein